MFQLWSSSSLALPLVAIKPGPLTQLLACWTRARADGRIPMLAKVLNPSLRPMMPNMALLQLSADGATARYVVVGAALVRLLGKDPTGRLVDEVYSRAISDEVNQALGSAAASGLPAFYQREFRILGRIFGYNRLMLPVARDDAGVSHVILALYPIKADLKDAAQWQDVLRQSQVSRKTSGTEWAWDLESRPKDAPVDPEDYWLI